MTIYSLALRIKEIADLQKEYDQTNDPDVLGRMNARKRDLHVLVESIISTYHVPEMMNSNEWYVDASQ